jgi:DNA-binding NtrC family response regulator
MIKKGEFREDLFYRLNVLPILLPPLRDRKNDIEHLVKSFVEKFNQQHKKNILGLAPDAMEALKNHSWPGNIRELENVIEHAFVIESESLIHVESLPESVKRDLPSTGLTRGDLVETEASETEAPNEVELLAAAGAEGLLAHRPNLKGFKLDINQLDFQANKEEFERQFLLSALKAFKGKINQTALHANIPKKTLLRKLEKYGITAKDFSDSDKS